MHSSDGSSKEAVLGQESKLVIQGLFKFRLKTNTNKFKFKYTHDDDLIANFEICQLLGDSTWKLSHSDQEVADYAHKGNKWVSYNDKQTLGKKVSLKKVLLFKELILFLFILSKINYLKKLELGGVFVFVINNFICLLLKKFNLNFFLLII